MPVRSLIEFHVRPGAEEAFAADYLALGFLSRAKAANGFLGGEFLRSANSPSSFWATALWEKAEHYFAWQTTYPTVFSEQELQTLAANLIEVPNGFVTDILDDQTPPITTNKGARAQ